jgi:N-acetylglucosamine-6-phosphate deacetylase
LLLENGRIAARLPATAPRPADAEPVSLGGALVAPGFLDIHHHGALPGGRADDATGTLIDCSASLVRHGVTAFLPTTVAWTAQDLAERVARIAESLEYTPWPGAVPIGLHLEGPWLRPEAAGAQPPGGIRPYDAREGCDLFDRAGSLLRLVTLAPEVEGARALEIELARRGVAIALGHTLADAAALRASVANGACHVTHLYNAMGSRTHREPRANSSAPDGFAALALAEDALGCDLIADGAHVHADWLRLAAETKGERAILISDRIDVDASSEGWLGAERMRSDGVAWRLPDGRLAGSLLRLDAAIRNAQEMRVMSFHDAVRACTLRPARLLGIEAERGTLRAGARADLVALDAAGSVRETWIAGRRVWPANSATSGSG